METSPSEQTEFRDQREDEEHRSPGKYSIGAASSSWFFSLGPAFGGIIIQKLRFTPGEHVSLLGDDMN